MIIRSLLLLTQMKNIKSFFAAAALCTSLLSSYSVHAGSDPCEVATCMWGMHEGMNPGECSSAVKTYFDILDYKGGFIDWPATAKKRLSFLNSCSGSDQSYNGMINAKFGMSKG